MTDRTFTLEELAEMVAKSGDDGRTLIPLIVEERRKLGLDATLAVLPPVEKRSVLPGIIILAATFATMIALKVTGVIA